MNAEQWIGVGMLAAAVSWFVARGVIKAVTSLRAAARIIKSGTDWMEHVDSALDIFDDEPIPYVPLEFNPDLAEWERELSDHE